MALNATLVPIAVLGSVSMTAMPTSVKLLADAVPEPPVSLIRTSMSLFSFLNLNSCH